MPDDLFGAPAAGGKFDAKEQEGRLLLVEPTGYRPEIETSFGTKDAVEANVVVLDGPDGPEQIDGALLFGRVLISQTRSPKTKFILGRLEKGTAKRGQQPPWRLADPTDADRTAARDYIAKNDVPF